MRAAVYYSNRDIRIQEVARPKIEAGELLVRVEASGICGSDVMEWYRKDRVPLILGHEVAGVIEEVGAGLMYKKGQRLALIHHVPCLKCHYCLNNHETTCETLRKTNFDPGGFCEFLRFPRINVTHGVLLLPESVSFDAATFVEPVACVLRGQRIAGLKKGKSVLVIGSGVAGLLHIHLASLLPADLIVATDVVEYRLQQARRFGAKEAVLADQYSPEIFRKLNHDRLADVVIVTCGAIPALTQAFESVERGGTILFFAPAQNNAEPPIPFNRLFWRTEITLTSSYAGGLSDYKEALDLISSSKIKVEDMITHRFPLAKIEEGFKLVEEAKESIKVIIYPQE
jgi:L-iditol 2-dehydrogenase